jgi:GTP cyclohydrolase I
MTKIETQNYSKEQIEALVASHKGTSVQTPLRADAFALSDAEKIARIEKSFTDIMLTLGLDLNDDSLKGTPLRVAKMYVQEAFSGLNPANEPAAKLFENVYSYNEMLIEKGITVHSHCEHHFVPIMGECAVAYIPNNKVVGLSKLNRIVRHYSKRPQVQERLTNQILEALKSALDTEDVAVYLDAEHMCVKTRGIEDQNSSTITMAFSGKFKEASSQSMFLNAIK